MFQARSLGNMEIAASDLDPLVELRTGRSNIYVAGPTIYFGRKNSFDLGLSERAKWDPATKKP